MATSRTVLDSYQARKRQHAVAIVAASSLAAPLMLLLVYRGKTPGLPHVAPILVLWSVSLALGLAAHRGSNRAPMWLAWCWGIALPILLEEPSITKFADFSMMLPAVLALALAGWRTILVVGTVPMIALIFRAPDPWHSPYLDPSVFLTQSLVVAALIGAHLAMLRAMRDLERSNALSLAMIKATRDVIILRDALPEPGNTAGTIRYVSPSFEQLLGFTPEELEGTTNELRERVHPEDQPALREQQLRMFNGTHTSFVCDVRAQHKDLNWVWIEARAFNLAKEPGVHGILTTLRDVTAERSERLARARAMEHAATHDALTGLPGRRKLDADLNELASERADRLVTAYFCDVDAFKYVNDGLGHAVGDQLLCKIAERLQAELAAGATLYRFGGDEFVIIFRALHASGTAYADHAAACTLLEASVLNAARAPLQIGPHLLTTTISIGVADWTTQSTGEELLRDADIALYASKQAGRNCASHFDASMRVRADRRHALEQAIRYGLQHGEFRTVYQPKVRAQTRALVGYEALLRWTSATLGHVSPAEFIGVAEEAGLIGELGKLALRSSCEFLDVLAQMGRPELSVAVNVSVKQMRDPAALVREVREALAERSIAGNRLELELTESVFLQDPESAISTLAELKALGVKLSVDDFGTGYSSLAYLRRFPVDTLKIDRAFVSELLESNKDYAIVAAIIAMARTLSLTTVAEGVEREDELAALQALGCDEIQGYFIAKPLERAAALGYAEPPSLRSLEREQLYAGAPRKVSQGVVVSVPAPPLRNKTPLQ